MYFQCDETNSLLDVAIKFLAKGLNSVNLKNMFISNCIALIYWQQRKYINALLLSRFLLLGGFFSPDIAKYSGMIRNVKFREYEFRQQKYYGDLLKNILLSRQVCDLKNKHFLKVVHT